MKAAGKFVVNDAFSETEASQICLLLRARLQSAPEKSVAVDLGASAVASAAPIVR